MNGNESIYYRPERSRGCNAADEVREARLSIPVAIVFTELCGVLRLRFAPFRMTLRS